MANTTRARKDRKRYDLPASVDDRYVLELYTDGEFIAQLSGKRQQIDRWMAKWVAGTLKLSA